LDPIFNARKQIWHIPETNQLATFSSKRVMELSAYRHVDFKDKVVLDVGACAGAFSKLALDRGARRVIAVEPHPLNLSVLRRNVPAATVIAAAAVPIDYDAPEVTFYEATSGNLTIGSTTRPRREHLRNTFMTKAIKFQDLLDEYRPDVVKMDVEGAEFELLIGPLPDYVGEFVAEFHIFMDKERMWRWWHDICFCWFDPLEWHVVKKPEWPDNDRQIATFHGFNVLTMGWRRKPRGAADQPPPITHLLEL
jgi:FkbM family methyltransferase